MTVETEFKLRNHLLNNTFSHGAFLCPICGFVAEIERFGKKRPCWKCNSEILIQKGKIVVSNLEPEKT